MARRSPPPTLRRMSDPFSPSVVQVPAAAEFVRRWVDVFNERDFDAYADLAAEAYVEHAISPFGLVQPGLVNGPGHLREVAEWLLAQFPDLRMTPQALVCEGSFVAVRVLSEGTNLGRLNGVMPATGRPFAAEQTHWFRVKDGRLAEHWATRDDLTVMLQLGVIAAPGGPGSPPRGAGGVPQAPVQPWNE
jgi:predicted ester cyclase